MPKLQTSNDNIQLGDLSKGSSNLSDSTNSSRSPWISDITETKRLIMPTKRPQRVKTQQSIVADHNFSLFLNGPLSTHVPLRTSASSDINSSQLFSLDHRSNINPLVNNQPHTVRNSKLNGFMPDSTHHSNSQPSGNSYSSLVAIPSHYEPHYPQAEFSTLEVGESDIRSASPLDHIVSNELNSIAPPRSNDAVLSEATHKVKSPPLPPFVICETELLEE